MVLIHRLLGFVPLLAMCGLIAFLEQRFSLGVGASIYMGVIILATLAGALLLRSSAVGQSNWRNALAAILLPCSGILGCGSLRKLCVSNLLGLILFGIASFGVARYVRHNDYAFERIGGWTIANGLAWIVLIGMVLFLLRQYGKGYYAGASGLRRFMKLIAAPASALALSIGLVIAGLPFVAFVVAMIPIAIVFVPMGLLLIMVIAMRVSGKPFRWN
jgi:hypothetical protein